jgi:FAD:protein FMN transferase
MPGTIAPARATFRALSTRVEVHATEPSSLATAVALTRSYLDRLDACASRFRADSEVSRLASGSGTASISTMLCEHLGAALGAAELTGGLVDPTVGRAMCDNGYDEDIDAVRARDTSTTGDGAVVPGWRTVHLVEDALEVTLPTGTLLDLGATAKAHAADDLAARLSQLLPGGFLVNLGGDLAIAGDLPDDGWRVGIEDGDDGDRTVETITLTSGGVATSSTRRRRWRTADGEQHHVVDPRTGRSATTPWVQVTVLASSALEANAWSTAAIVLGDDAPAWLFERRVAAWLQDGSGASLVTPHWPSAPSEVT